MATTRQHHCIWTGARDTLHTGRGRKESESDTWRRAVLGCMSWCLSGMQMAAQLQLQLLHIEPGKKLVIREESKASRCKAAAGFRRGDADAPPPRLGCWHVQYASRDQEHSLQCQALVKGVQLSVLKLVFHTKCNEARCSIKLVVYLLYISKKKLLMCRQVPLQSPRAVSLPVWLQLHLNKHSLTLLIIYHVTNTWIK